MINYRFDVHNSILVPDNKTSHIIHYALMLIDLILIDWPFIHIKQ